MRKLIYAAALCAAFFMPIAGNAACTSIEAFNAEISIVGWSAMPLTGEELAKATVVYNSAPPESEAVIGAAALVNRPDGGGFLVVGPYGAYCGILNFDEDHFRPVTNFIRGTVS